MQRQIKFRVWDTKSKKFLEFIPPREYMLDQDEWSHHDMDDTSSLTYPEYVCQQNFDDRLVWQQFTGLLDKNNKEIFECDILKNDLNTIFQVIWNEDGFFTCRADTNNTWIFCKKGVENSEVIGNIFENSESLKNK